MEIIMKYLSFGTVRLCGEDYKYLELFINFLF